MKITKVETIELRQSTEVHWGVIGWLWVRIHTDEGIIGLGETCPAGAVEKAVVLNDLAPRLIGRDPRDIEAIWHDLLMAVQYRGWAGAEIRAISAVDVALWDLFGKLVDLPLYRLLGGKCWDSIPRNAGTFAERRCFTMSANWESPISFSISRGNSRRRNMRR